MKACGGQLGCSDGVIDKKLDGQPKLTPCGCSAIEDACLVGEATRCWRNRDEPMARRYSLDNGLRAFRYQVTHAGWQLPSV